jgi:hypothetical protein
MNNGIIIGRLIESNARTFRFACPRSTILLPQLGDMVSAEAAPLSQIYGIIAGINFTTDDLTTRLAQGEIDKSILADNQYQRFAGGQWVDVCMVGYKNDNQIFPTLPPRPPLSLEEIRFCSTQEIIKFTQTSLSYFRLLLDLRTMIPLCDVLSSHLFATHICHETQGNPGWIKSAVDYLTGLVDDRLILLGIMSALSSKIPDQVFA